MNTQANNPVVQPAVQETAREEEKTLFGKYLMNKNSIFEHICCKFELNRLIKFLLLICFIGAGLMGVSLGFYSMDIRQFLASTVKLPMLLMLSTLICFPSLFMFNTLLGNRMSMKQMSALVLLGLADMGIFLASFSPIMLFFIFTSRNYLFTQFLLTAFCAASGLISFITIQKGYSYYNKRFKVKSNFLILPLWVIIFGFVGIQLSWILRPYIGSPSMDFTFFRHFGSNIFVHFLNALTRGIM